MNTEQQAVLKPDRDRRRRPSLALRTFIILAVVGLATWIWQDHVDTYHFAAAHPGVLYRDGNRSLNEFDIACRRGDVRTVVMLVDDEEVRREPFRSEIEYCREKGIRLVHIPVPLGTMPRTRHVRRFLDVMEDPASHPVLVHCAQGVRRTGMMVAAYQESMLGHDDQRATEAILSFDHSVRTTGGIRDFIEFYDGGTRTVNLPRRKRDRQRRAG